MDKHNFRLSLIEDLTHRQRWTLHFSRFGLAATVVTIILVIFVAAYLLIAYTPLRVFIPGYPDENARRQAMLNAMRIDSLETKILQWELYTENLKRVVDGEKPIRFDSLVRRTNAERERIVTERMMEADSLLRSEVEHEQQFDLSGQKRILPIEGVHFFVPLKGVVSAPYDPLTHPYVDLTAPANSVVMAALDGTVVLTEWNEDDGYSLAIQHEGDIITVYKHTVSLLKKRGATVSAGTPIALLGDASGTGDHLRFEIWYKGRSVNPAQYINF